MARLQQLYREKLAPELMAKFGYKSPMQVPRLTKITLNMGVSEAVSDKKVMDNAVGDLTKIAGQLGIPVFAASTDMDPADICLQARVAAHRQGCDTVILDTAGRLHIDGE